MCIRDSGKCALKKFNFKKLFLQPYKLNHSVQEILNFRFKLVLDELLSSMRPGSENFKLS